MSDQKISAFVATYGTATDLTGMVLPGEASGVNKAYTTALFDARYAQLSGATFTGKLNTVASASGTAGFNLPAGAAPTSPVNGDLWTTTASLFTRINGTTYTMATLEGAQTFSGANTFSGGVTVSGSSLISLKRTSGGGNPVNSGTSDANQFIITGNSNVDLRLGLFASGAAWVQNSLSADYSSNLNIVFNPNGGNIGIGNTSSTVGTLLTVAGPIATSAPSTKTTNYSLVATDSSLIFNGAGSITLTLQAASTFTGRWLTVKTIAAQTVISASSNVVPLVGGSAGTAILSATAGKWAILQSDGTNWIIMAAN